MSDTEYADEDVDMERSLDRVIASAGSSLKRLSLENYSAVALSGEFAHHQHIDG